MIHAIDEVCDLEIKVKSLREFLGSGVRTKFVHGSQHTSAREEKT